MIRRSGHPAVPFLSLALALCLSAVVGAQEPPSRPAQPPAGQAPEAGADQAEAEDPAATGDAWVDAQLVDIGRYGRRHRETFIDELVRYREVPRAVVVELLDERDWEPGDVYFACSLAGVTGRSCRFIADQRGQSPTGSWDAFATGLGAGAGSDAFARLKRGIVHSYQRWARPLDLDPELAGSFPGHDEPPPPPADAGDGEG